MPVILANIGRLVGGSIADLPKVISRRFRRLSVERPRRAPIQVDGELVDAEACVEVSVATRAINVLVPSPAGQP
jgi:diacylglycerol kinase family enzyme